MAPKLIPWVDDNKRREYRATLECGYIVIVHGQWADRMHGDPETLYVTCKDLDVSSRPLAQRDINHAKAAALGVIADALGSVAKKLNSAVTQLEADAQARRR